MRHLRIEMTMFKGTMTYGEEDPDFLDHIKEAFPGIPEHRYWSLLQATTAFGFADAATVIQQLKDIYEKSGGDPDLAEAIANEELDKRM